MGATFGTQCCWEGLKQWEQRNKLPKVIETPPAQEVKAEETYVYDPHYDPASLMSVAPSDVAPAKSEVPAPQEPKAAQKPAAAPAAPALSFGPSTPVFDAQAFSNGESSPHYDPHYDPASMVGATLSAVVGPPTAACCPPGQCAFTDEWSMATLVDRSQDTKDTILVEFALPDGEKPLGLSTCACILCKMDDPAGGEPIIRPYTPVSTNAMKGKFQLFLRVYPEGKMSQYLANLALGSQVAFKHISKNVKIQYPFGKKHVTMLAGGTGITPMIQALHAILGTEGDKTQVSMIYFNRFEKDILCKELLDTWARNSNGRFKLQHVLSRPQGMDGPSVHLNAEMLKQYSAMPAEDPLVMVCGPPRFYESLCGKRDEAELTGLLKDVGFDAKQVFKF